MKTKCLFSGLAFVLLPMLANAAITVKFVKPGKLSATLYQGASVHSVVPAENVPNVQFEDADSKAGKWTVHVEDQNSGNEAIVPIRPPGEAEIKPDDFRFVSRLTLKISDAKGASPDVAIVTLKDAKGASQTTTLAAPDGGKAAFQHVAAGEATATVQQGSPTNRQTVSLRLDLKRAAPVPELPLLVALPDGMKTTAQAASPQPTSAPAPPASKAPPILRGFLNGLGGFVFALLALAAIVVFTVKSLRARGVTVKSALATAGVQLPDDPEPIAIVQAEPPKPVDPTICPYCGARKEANAPCAQCAVGARAQSSAPAPAGPLRLVCVAGPRAGESFAIAQGLTVGRDTERGIAVTGDGALSRQHATFDVSAGGVTVVDSGSSNGTWVNGRKVDRVALRAGDEVTMGSSKFRVEV